MKTRQCLIMCVASLCAGSVATAGDLNPPIGAVAPSMKSLSQVAPRTAMSATNTPGDADSVFRIAQPGSYYLTEDVVGIANKTGVEIAASDVALDLNGFAIRGVGSSLGGISAQSEQHRIHIRNGCVMGWASSGILLTLGQTSGIVVDQVRAVGNGGSGIAIGRDSRVSNCTGEQNGSSGIDVLVGSSVADCMAARNGGVGIAASADTTITRCTARSNQSHGIDAFRGVLVEACVVTENVGHGIDAGYDCVVRGNLCRGNGFGAGIGAGICVAPSFRSNRIEDNQLIANDHGLRIDGDNNVIVGNTARGNGSGNFSVVAGNELAPVVTNPGSSNFTTATPWSNFAF